MGVSPDSEAAGVAPDERGRLSCLECGATARGDATGWRAHLSTDNELRIYCGACVPLERGGSAAA